MKRRQYFMHIRKTAGTSLYSLIQRNYDWKTEILYQATIWDEFFRLPPKKLHQALFIRGHTGVNLLKLIRQDIDYFTFLRSPIKRCLSDINYAKNAKHWPHQIITNEGLSAKEAILDDRVKPIFFNHQTASLGLDLTLSEIWNDRPLIQNIIPRYYDEILSRNTLENAKRTLRQSYFIGIAEAFDLSYLTLCFLNGWRPDLNADRRRAVPKTWLNETLDSDCLSRLEEMNTNDHKLYDYGVTLFVDQINQIFNLNVSIPDVFPGEHKLKNELVQHLFEIANKNYIRHLAGQKEQSHWDAGMEIRGTGWHDVHDPERNPHRWSGPGNRSDLDLRLENSCDYDLIIEIFNSSHKSILPQMKVFANGNPVAHRLTGKCIKMRIPRSAIPPNGLMRITFEVPGTYPLKPSGPESGDSLLRGFALRSYHLNRL